MKTRKLWVNASILAANAVRKHQCGRGIKNELVQQYAHEQERASSIMVHYVHTSSHDKCLFEIAIGYPSCVFEEDEKGSMSVEKGFPHHDTRLSLYYKCHYDFRSGNYVHEP